MELGEPKHQWNHKHLKNKQKPGYWKFFFIYEPGNRWTTHLKMHSSTVK